MKRHLVLALFLALSLVAFQSLGGSSLTISEARPMELTETDQPACRWYHAYGQNLYLTWGWSSGAYTRFTIAYDNAANEWQWTPTILYMSYSSYDPHILVSTRFAPEDPVMGRGGVTCMGEYVAQGSCWLNRYQEALTNWSDHWRQKYAAHELGHTLALGHIPDPLTTYAVMRVSVIHGDTWWWSSVHDETIFNQNYWLYQ